MFAARAEERIYLAPPRRPGELRRRWISASLVVAIYALAGASLVYEGGLRETPTQSEETPIEIIVEPPPPPPPAPQPTPTPEPQSPPPPVDLTPAYDAPRAGTADADTGDKDKASPPPPAAAAEDKSAERASGAEAKAEAPQPEAAPTPEPTAAAQPSAPAPPMKISEGEVPTPAPQPAPEPKPTPTPQPETEAAAPAKPAPAAGKSAPLFASVPDVDFGGAAMKTPYSGGTARANYLSILYGAIMPHFHPPRGGRAALGRGYGVVAFTVDAQGRLVNRYVVEESGLPELDRAAIDAVGAASPFPPPPLGFANRGVQFKYDLK